MAGPNRETRLKQLAEKLLFDLRKDAGRYSLVRTADVSEPVRHEGLTLEQAEQVLNTWKLRGLHGG